MNKINFTVKDNFPLSADTMKMMQQMIRLNANMALLGGSNYILSGCDDDGTTVGSGIIVIEGELFMFEGGAKKSKITIVETSQTLHAFGVDYPQAYIIRTAKFSDTGEYNWTDFTQISTILKLKAQLDALAPIPTGIIVMWSGDPDSIPSGWALCDGSHGTPDLSGKFIVGFNRQDDDYNDTGKTGGYKKVALTEPEMPKHTHTFTDRVMITSRDNPSSNGSTIAEASGETRFALNSPNLTGGGEEHENRPPYYVLAFIIKL